MADNQPEPTSRSAATASSSKPTPNLPPSAAVRHRLPQRQASSHEASPSPRPSLYPRRRSSLLSFSSLEDLRQSFNEDIINPKTVNHRNLGDDEEITHWHSTPLAFAILPALGGLFFKDGSAFITDVLLLGLAAIFMNWSIRLPWDWYYSAQAVRRDAKPEPSLFVEEVEGDTAVETSSETGYSPALSPGTLGEETLKPPIQDLGKREQAGAELRRQELTALVATFVFPMLAAYLLHVIRSQLSRPSTSLVSDYNLSIFLLAAEIRPCRQLIRLVSARTLYLQRTVSGATDSSASLGAGKLDVSSLANRIEELEAKIADHTVLPPTVTVAQKADVSDLSTEMKKRYEPRLEGLERAVRRYEKRFTTLAMVSEQRMASLETRVQEALSLAAVAAQNSRNRGVVGKFTDTVAVVLTWPGKIAWSIVSSPISLVEELYVKFKALLFGPTPRTLSRRKGTKPDSNGRDERSKDKSLVRRIVK